MKRAHAIPTILINLLGLALLIYTGSRTVDFIGLTLPAGQQPLAFVGLAAFDGGLIGWLLYYLKGARGQWQRGIALLMIVVSLIGVVIAFTGDTLYHAAARGLTTSADPALVTTVIWSMTAIIAANIAALVGVHLLDPDVLRAHADRDARDAIDEETTTQIGASSATLAATIAPRIAAAWARETTARYLPAVHVETPPEPADLPAALTPALVHSTNGHSPAPLVSPNGHSPDPKANGRSNGAAPTP